MKQEPTRPVPIDIILKSLHSLQEEGIGESLLRDYEFLFGALRKFWN